MNHDRQQAFKIEKLNPKDLLELQMLIKKEIWTSEHDYNYKTIPTWVNSSPLNNNYDNVADASIPDVYKKFGEYVLKKYFNLNEKLTGACLWNGADDTGWHTDLDGTDSHTDKFTMIIYHIPYALTEIDGGNLMIKDTSKGVVENIIPEDGMIILLKLDPQKYQHCAFKLTGEKDRYTLSFGFN